MLLFVITLIIPIFDITSADYKSYKDYKVYEIEGDAQDIMGLVTSLSDDEAIPYYMNTNSSAEIIIAPDLEEDFSKAVHVYKLNKKMLIKDFSRIIKNEKPINRQNKLSFSWTAYYDVDDIYDYLKDMSKRYSKWTDLVVGGQSYEGRKILGLRIKTPTAKVYKQIVFIESGIHAREWIAPATTTYFINQLLTSTDPAITSLRDQFEWHIFPTVNPDGYHYSYTVERFWRKTRSKSSEKCYGSDPNRNWDYNWGKSGISTDPCDDIYPGIKPFSEVETRTLSEYILSLNITAYIGFHSFGPVLLIPYSDSLDNISNYDDLVKIGKTSIEYGGIVNGTTYVGPVTSARHWYSASGGSMDWVRYKLNTPLVFTYELRGEGFSWPPERIPEQGEEVTRMLIGLFIEACRLNYC
ncbi:zinc carboxypeptidase-like [Amyelois transitella]|uniref:zinc carboxypeptidase-like n=1 Tax=Amyelois transitella TaxID=680683 RepID=UPI00067C238E|nr:zinc carboxypeptidase-like [Amyelois transitella]